MNALYAVLKDFYIFGKSVVEDVSGLFKDTAPQQPPLLTAPKEGDIFVEETITIITPLEEASREEEDVPQTFKSTADVFKERSFPEKNTVMYTGSSHTAVWQEPTTAFDSVVAHIPYGALVMILEQRGRWSRIVYREIAGWVLRDELIDRAAYVYPEFSIGVPNGAEDPNTLRLRAVIEDEFNGGAAELPLQSSEYVWYRLCRKNVHLAWPAQRPRTEGTWHTVLKGLENVHIGIQPKVGAVMEYSTDEGIGHLAYVEAVFPDDTLSISEVNFPDQGAYNERVLTKEEWRELKPVFIEVS